MDEPLEFSVFEAEAERCWGEVPTALKAGVVGLFVHPDARFDPEFRDVPLMGECQPEAASALVPGAPIRSILHLYYGSFQIIGEREPEFDWYAEIEETVLHELRHHLDWRQGHDTLGLEDDLQRQNMLRLSDEPFLVDFYRHAPRASPGVTCVDTELFFDAPLSRGDWRRVFDERVVVRWQGRTFRAGPAAADAPRRKRGPIFLAVDALDEPDDAPEAPVEDWQYASIVVRRRGWFERCKLELSFEAP